jgi:parvulin-like peptidyl-prolyl isomerase
MKGEFTMRSAGFWFLALAALGLALGCSKTDNKAAAKVGKDVITVKMVKDQYLAISPSARPDLKTIDEKEAFAKDIVAKHILWLEARKLGLDKLPEIAQAGRQMTTSKAWQLYFENEVRSRVKPTEAEIEKLYQRQQTNYHLAWIFVRSRALADEISRRLSAGEDFAKLAAAYSVDASRAEGGDAGVRSLGVMPATAADKVEAMSPGQVSDVIPFETYYVIIKLVEKQPVESEPIEQARTGLESMARSIGENARQRELATEMKKTYELTVNPAAVDMIVAKTRALYPSADVAPGAIPQFSDEEMDRDLARWKGGDWKVGNYAESIKSLREFMRPGFGVDKETIESIIGDFVTGELWTLEIKTKGYETRPEALEAGRRAVEEAVVTTLHDQIVKDVTVDDAALEAFYTENKAQLVTEPGVTLAVILTKDEAGAKAAYDQLAAGAAFATVAKQKSIDKDSAEKGGALPRPLYKRDLEQFPDLEGVLANLQVGAYSTPMPIPPGFGAEGYMVVKLVERSEPRQLDLAEVKEMLRPQVLQLEQDKVFAGWLKGKMDEYKVEILPAGLNAVDFTPLKNQGA